VARPFRPKDPPTVGRIGQKGEQRMDAIKYLFGGGLMMVGAYYAIALISQWRADGNKGGAPVQKLDELTPLFAEAESHDVVELMRLEDWQAASDAHADNVAKRISEGRHFFVRKGFIFVLCQAQRITFPNHGGPREYQIFCNNLVEKATERLMTPDEFQALLLHFGKQELYKRLREKLIVKKNDVNLPFANGSSELIAMQKSAYPKYTHHAVMAYLIKGTALPEKKDEERSQIPAAAPIKAVSIGPMVRTASSRNLSKEYLSHRRIDPHS